MRILVSAFLSAAIVSPAPHAAVIDVQPHGFAASNEAVIHATPEHVYQALLDIGRWWDPEHTYSGAAGNMSIEAKPGGCFCERIPGKGDIEHMRIVYLSKNSTVRMAGGLGPLQELGVAGSLTWSLTADASGTKLVQSYQVGGYRQGGFAEFAPLVDQVLNIQLQRLKAFSETGNPGVPAAGSSAGTR